MKMITGAMLIASVVVAANLRAAEPAQSGETAAERNAVSEQSEATERLARIRVPDWGFSAREEGLLLADAGRMASGLSATHAHAGKDDYLKCPKCGEVEKSSLFVRATASGATVGVVHRFSTWSDMTALFRPSRWRHPIRAGGTLSWLNPKAWRDEPGRTGKVLLGEAIILGAGYAIYESSRSDKDKSKKSDPAPDPVPASGGRLAGDGSAGGGSDGGDTGGGDTGGGPPPGDTGEVPI